VRGLHVSRTSLVPSKLTFVCQLEREEMSNVHTDKSADLSLFEEFRSIRCRVRCLLFALRGEQISRTAKFQCFKDKLVFGTGKSSLFIKSLNLYI
jgi:hypothetical protein